MRPRRAAEAFWRCEQAFERRTRDMIFPPFSGECAMIEGAFGAGFRGFGVERIFDCGWLASLGAGSRGRRRARGGELRTAKYRILVRAMDRYLGLSKPRDCCRLGLHTLRPYQVTGVHQFDAASPNRLQKITDGSSALASCSQVSNLFPSTSSLQEM